MTEKEWPCTGYPPSIYEPKLKEKNGFHYNEWGWLQLFFDLDDIEKGEMKIYSKLEGIKRPFKCMCINPEQFDNKIEIEGEDSK